MYNISGILSVCVCVHHSIFPSFSVCVCVCVCVYICPSVHLSFFQSVCLSLHLSLFAYPSICPSVRLFICLSPFGCQSDCSSVYLLKICVFMFLHLPICLPVSLFIYSSIHLFMCQSGYTQCDQIGRNL